jgi:hypothetical protein
MAPKYLDEAGEVAGVIARILCRYNIPATKDTWAGGPAFVLAPAKTPEYSDAPSLLIDGRRRACPVRLNADGEYYDLDATEKGIIGGLRIYARELMRAIDAKDLADALEGKLKRCRAHQDGDCFDKDCPQNRDNEPMRSGRHCPLDRRDEDEENTDPPPPRRRAKKPPKPSIVKLAFSKDERELLERAMEIVSITTPGSPVLPGEWCRAVVLGAARTLIDTYVPGARDDWQAKLAAMKTALRAARESGG